MVLPFLNVEYLTQHCVLGPICVLPERNAYSSIVRNVAAIKTIVVGTSASSSRSSVYDERTHTLSSSVHARIPNRRKR